MSINCPNCNHVLFTTDSNSPGQSVGGASSPSAAVPASGATAGGTPSCKHGQMFYKAGTNKAGKPYAGHFCPEDDCKPVWTPA